MKCHPYNGTALALFRTGIIEHHYESGCRKIGIDVESLFDMTDEELLKCSSIGPHRLKEVNAARRTLIELLFKSK